MGDAFIQAFFAIDTDNSGEITMPELVEYMSKNNFSETFIKKWLCIFDADQSGTISLEEYCDTLGLEVKDVLEKYQISRPKRLPKDVEVIFADMELEMQMDIAEIVRDSMKLEQKSDWPRTIKRKLDEQFGRLWHVIVLRGEFWELVSHEPGMAFNFKLNKHIFLTWRTPGV